MITIYISEADYQYDIHSLTKAFFAREDLKVSADWSEILRWEQEQKPLFRLEIIFCPKQYGGKAQEDRMKIALKIPGSECRSPAQLGAGAGGEEQAQLGAEAGGEEQAQLSAETEADFADRKETKNRLKRCLYQILSNYCKQTLPWGTLTGIRPVKLAMSMLEEGKKEQEIRTFMSETYLASEQKINLSVEIARREMELLGQIDYKDGYSLYIGIPFCPSICSYCSFSSFPIEKWKDRAEDYLDALSREMDDAAKVWGHKKLNTVYIGGGTPTTLSHKQLGRLLAKIEERFDLSSVAEYTVEAGRPDSITGQKLKVLKDYGVTRISINPQTMKQETLNIIGRRHTVEETVESFLLARELGFDNINMDLIMGLPKETLADVQETMEKIKELSPDSLTVHSLAIKRAARFKMFAEEYAGMQMENTWETIGLAAEYARKMGLQPYYLYRQKNMAGNFENVGYARPGKAGLYNILMMEEKQSILALGAGSISKRVNADGQIQRCENVKNVAQYMERIDEMTERKKQLFEV